MARTNVSFATPAGGTVWLNWVTGFSYSPPDSKFTGFDSFQFRWWDKAGFSEPVTVNLRVGSVGDGAAVPGITPTAGADHYATPAGGTLTVSAGTGLLANDSAFGGATLAATPQTGTTARGGTVSVAADGGFAYTPPAGVRGPDSFEYGIVDSYGATARATATIDLLNNAPTAGNLSFTTNRATPVTADLLAGAADADGDPLTVSIAVGPFRGSISLEATTGAFTYTPSTNFTGIETLPFTVSDGSGGTISKAVIVTVVNATPNGQNLEIFTERATTVYDSVLLSADDEDFDQITAEIVALPTLGTVNLLANGDFTYIPDADFAGQDTFTYKLFDGIDYSSVYTVTLTVGNDAPNANDDEYDLWPAGMLVVSAEGGVLDNDYDSDILTATLITGPSYAATGTFQLNGDGSFEYELAAEPPPEYDGHDSFTYTASDGIVASGPRTVTITLRGTVVGTEDLYEVPDNGNGPLTVSASNGVLRNDRTAPGTAITAVLDQDVDPADGSLSLNPDGSFTFVPSGTLGEEASFTYIPWVAGAATQHAPVLVKLVREENLNEVRLVSLSYKTNHPIIRSDSGKTLGMPQWNDKNGDGTIQGPDDHANPVSYTRESKMLLNKVEFKISGDANKDWKDYMPGGTKTLLMRATGSGGVTFGFATGNTIEGKLDKTVVPNGDPIYTIRLKKDEVRSDAALPDKIDYFPEFELEWEFSRDGGESWYSPTANKSRTPVYVTWGDPNPILNNKFYESLLWITGQEFLKNSDGDYYGASKVADLAFEAFKSMDVKRKDGGTLKYYGNWNTQSTTFVDLLRNGSGTCGAFAELFQGMLFAQGLNSTAIAPESKYYRSAKEYMLINDWNFAEFNIIARFDTIAFSRFTVDNKGTPTPATPGLATVTPLPSLQQNGQPAPAVSVFYNWFNIPKVGDNLNNVGVNGVSLAVSSAAGSHQWDGTPVVTHAGGVAGQNNPSPKAMFPNHRLISIGGVLYDPSYGKTYASVADFESKAVAGFVIERQVKESDVGIDLDGLNGVTDKAVRIFLFRKIVEGGDLI
jgi:hypothetical protein